MNTKFVRPMRIYEADLRVVAYGDFTFIDPLDSLEEFVEGIELPPEFVTSPISLNICCDSAAVPETPPLEADVQGNNDFEHNNVGPLPFSRHLHPHGMAQP